MLKTNLPVLIISDVVLFPHTEIKIELNNINDKKIVSLAENYFNNYLFIICSNDDYVKNTQLPNLGVVAQIKVTVKAN